MCDSMLSCRILVCVVIISSATIYSAFSEEENDSAIFFEYPHHHHAHTIRDVESRRVPDDARPCTSEGISGKCVEIIHCPPAMKSVYIQKHHNYKRCGFHGRVEVICCPEEYIEMNIHLHTRLTNTTEPTTTHRNSTNTSVPKDPHSKSRIKTRKCVQVCEEYSNEIKPDVTLHILEGEDAEPKEFPHMVALGYNSDTIGELKWSCAGSLISGLYVLTAAHCIINADQNPPVRAKMGMVNIDDPAGNGKAQEYDIVNITIHPKYDKWDKLNDIALIKLNKKVKNTDYIHPACLYDKDDDPVGMIVTGWGDKELGGEGSKILQKAKLTAVPLQECKVTYLTRASRKVMSTQICAADNKSDTCQGDSGGPLQVENIANSSVHSIVGITSYGIGCGSKYPGIYTRVSSYLDWIESIAWGNS